MNEDTVTTGNPPDIYAGVLSTDSAPSLLVAKWKQVVATFPLQRDAGARERRAHRLVAREIRRLQAPEQTL